MLQSWHLPSLLIFFKSLYKMYITTGGINFLMPLVKMFIKTGGIVLFNVALGSIYKVHYSYTLILFPSYFQQV